MILTPPQCQQVAVFPEHVTQEGRAIGADLVIPWRTPRVVYHKTPTYILDGKEDLSQPEPTVLQGPYKFCIEFHILGTCKTVGSG